MGGKPAKTDQHGRQRDQAPNGNAETAEALRQGRARGCQDFAGLAHARRNAPMPELCQKSGKRFQWVSAIANPGTGWWDSVRGEAETRPATESPAVFAAWRK